MDNVKKEFGKRLADLRKNKKLNQEQFKNLINAPTVQMISGWENGHSFPSATYLIIISKKLDTSLDYLLLGKENNSDSKEIKTYKDAAINILNLIDCGLFKVQFSDFRGIYSLELHTQEKTISTFYSEYQKLVAAKTTLGSDLYEAGIVKLLNNYDILIKK